MYFSAEQLDTRTEADVTVGVCIEHLDEPRNLRERRGEVGVPVPGISSPAGEGVQHSNPDSLSLSAICRLHDGLKTIWRCGCQTRKYVLCLVDTPIVNK
jgi:hypothetical protein